MNKIIVTSRILDFTTFNAQYQRICLLASLTEPFELSSGSTREARDTQLAHYLTDLHRQHRNGSAIYALDRKRDELTLLPGGDHI